MENTEKRINKLPKEANVTFEATSINKDMIAQMIEPAIEVIIANPNDLEKIDSQQVDNYIWFIKDHRCDEGMMFLIKGKTEKLYFIKQGLMYPDMVLKGKLVE